MFRTGNYDSINEYNQLKESFERYTDPNKIHPDIVQCRKGNTIVIYMEPTLLYPIDKDITGLNWNEINKNPTRKTTTIED